MEPHKELPAGTESYRPDFSDGPDAYYRKAMAFTRAFYGDELKRISSVRLEDVTPSFFFNEYVWVVHATGFKASVVGKMMPRLASAYGTWDALADESFDDVMARVGPVCNNPGKAGAVHKTAVLMKSDLLVKGSWEKFRKSRLSSPRLLARLPYIGPITSFHLGRNIGLLDCVKPDLHLVRMAAHWGFKDCESMCRSMRGSDDVPLGIVDLALWYAASTFGTLEIRRDGER
jgi:hypothetical protein